VVLAFGPAGIAFMNCDSRPAFIDLSVTSPISNRRCRVSQSYWIKTNRERQIDIFLQNEIDISFPGSAGSAGYNLGWELAI
jgi:hypothetical protein